jgi:hypothetical protein
MDALFCPLQYSFGIMMWELIALREPYGGSRSTSVSMSVVCVFVDQGLHGFFLKEHNSLLATSLHVPGVQDPISLQGSARPLTHLRVLSILCGAIPLVCLV